MPLRSFAKVRRRPFFPAPEELRGVRAACLALFMSGAVGTWSRPAVAPLSRRVVMPRVARQAATVSDTAVSWELAPVCISFCNMIRVSLASIARTRGAARPLPCSAAAEPIGTFACLYRSRIVRVMLERNSGGERNNHACRFWRVDHRNPGRGPASGGPARHRTVDGAARSQCQVELPAAYSIRSHLARRSLRGCVHAPWLCR